MSRLISVVLPVYNEADNIATCLGGLWGALEDERHEILVVYDFDEDTTLPAIEAMADRPPSVRLVRNELGRGAANALRAGFAAADGDVVVTTMADLSDPPERIPALAEKVRAGADVVAGSRYVRGGSQTGGPLLKRSMSRAAGLLLHALAGVGTHDATSNFRAYSKRFLDSVEVESAGGFEVALELTVKAHLAGRAVDEVPSSWTDRSAGESRFRLWKWLPHYLGWFLKAALAPALAWLALAGLTLVAALGVEPGSERALGLARVLLPAALGAGAIALARRVRGRNVLADVLHAFLWVPPAQGAIVRSVGLPAALVLAAAASGALILATTARERRTRALAELRGLAAATFRERTVGYVLLGLLLWISHAAPPGDAAGDGLDEGWEQVLGYGLVHGLQWGRDLVFTFGPLGYFNRGRYEPELFWTKVVWWELVVKAVVVVFYMTAFARIRGALSRTLFYLAVLLPLSGHDTFWFLGTACVVIWCLERPDRGVLPTAVGIVAVALMGLVKFTVFVYAGFAVAVLAAVLARRRSLGAGVAVLAGYAAAVVWIWTLCGQELSSLPAFVKHSGWIAKHYTSGQSLVGPPADLVLGGVTLLACILVAVQYVAARPWRVEKLASAALVLAVLYFAGKSGFTRHGINAIRFFTVSMAAPFLLAPPRRARGLDDVGGDSESGTGGTVASDLGSDVASEHGAVGTAPFTAHRAARRTSWAAAWPAPGAGPRAVACWAIFGVSLYGYHSVLEHGRHWPSRLFGDWTAAVSQAAEGFLDLEGLREEREAERARLVEQHGLPRLRAIVGDASADYVHNRQGVLLLNGLDYRPRPIFQSYQVNSPELLALNRALYESERAPEYVLFEFDTTDHRYPNMEDCEVLRVLMKDYAAVDFERGVLLLRRRADAPRDDAPEVVLERTIAFGETVEVPEVGADETLWVELRFEDTALGRVGTTLVKTPPLHVLCRDSFGEGRRFRIAPGITPSGLLAQPFPIHALHWARWFAGADLGSRVTSFSIEDDEWVRRWWKPEIGVRFVRRRPGRPEAAPGFQERVRYSMLATPPTSAEPAARRSQIRGVEVLAVETPSELRWELAPGRYHATGEFGIDPRSLGSGSAAPTTFRVLLRTADGREGVLFKKTLDPAREPLDRRLQTFSQRIDTGEALTLVLATSSATDEEASAVGQAFWIEVAVERAPDETPGAEAGADAAGGDGTDRGTGGR